MVKQIAAVGYVRMSTDDQETSPEQQRDEVNKYADNNGYKIVDWYEDLGISGDRTDKRFGFQRMIAAASTHQFDAILCWDQDRFGRFDMIEAGRWIHPLREAGVHLATVTDGRMDWSDMASRLVYSVKQEGKHQYLRDLSANVVRAMDKMAADGKWLSGVPPFGYVKDADHRLQLGSPEDVALVKEIFRRYIAGEPTRSIARWLGQRGMLSPKGSKWSANGIGGLLKNERYLGYLVYNQRTESKYKTKENPKGTIKYLPREKWKIVPNTHPAIVTQAEFDAAQAQMKSHTSKRLPDGGKPYALAGILRCGKCGSPMIADKCNGVPSYTCYKYREHPDECERYNVRERQTLKAILSALRTEFFDRYLTPANIEQIKARMREILSGTRADAEVIQGHIAKIEHQIDQAKRRLVEVSPDMIRHVEERIRELEDQRDGLLPQLDAATVPADDQISAVDKRIEAAIGWLDRLEEIADTDYDTAEVNRMLRQFVDRVEVDVERAAIGKKGSYHKCILRGGAIFLRMEALPIKYMVEPTAEVR